MAHARFCACRGGGWTGVVADEKCAIGLFHKLCAGAERIGDCHGGLYFILGF